MGISSIEIRNNESGNSAGVTNNALDVNIQDQTTEPLNWYLCKENGKTNPSSNTDIDDQTISVVATTGASVGDCINIIEDGRLFQSIISDITDLVITFNSPLDYAYTTSAQVCFGEWDLSTADGSTTPVIFKLCPPTGKSYDIYDIFINMEDNAVMYESTFAGINALTNGIVGRVTDGYDKNLFLCTNNAGFREQGFQTEYPDKVPSGTYAFWGNKNYNITNGVAIRLNGDSEDSIQIIVQDDLTDISKIAVTVQGHVVE